MVTNTKLQEIFSENDIQFGFSRPSADGSDPATVQLTPETSPTADPSTVAADPQGLCS